jgi:hypothetical protein
MKRTEYVNALNNMAMTRDMESRILKRSIAHLHGLEDAASMEDSSNPAKTRGARRLVPILLVVLLVVLAGTTVFASRVLTGDWLGLILGTEGGIHLKELATNPGESIVCGDVRVTMESVLGDGTAFYMLLDIDTVSGAPLSEDPLASMDDDSKSNLVLPFDIQADNPSALSGVMSFHRVDDGSDPTHARLIMSASLSDARRIPRWVRFTFTSIDGCYPAGDQVEYRRIASGSWSFLFAGRTKTQTVTSCIAGDVLVRVTPLSFTLTATTTEPFFRDFKELRAELVDGSTVPLYETYGGGDGVIWSYYGLFGNVLDPTRVVAFLYDGERYELK